MGNYTCKRCGALIKVNQIDFCEKCSSKNREDLKTIRKYLDNKGRNDIYSISKNTGVSLKVINLLINDESLFIKVGDDDDE